MPHHLIVEQGKLDMYKLRKRRTFARAAGPMPRRKYSNTAALQVRKKDYMNTLEHSNKFRTLEQLRAPKAPASAMS